MAAGMIDLVLFHYNAAQDLLTPPFQSIIFINLYPVYLRPSVVKLRHDRNLAR
jgi:hypothetical protein